MGFRELVKKVQDYSGFTISESKDALEHMVESLAVHLAERERKDFASQLPQRLKDIALTVYATEQNSRQDIIEQFMENQRINRQRAKRQIQAAWQALKSGLSAGQINHVRAQLSKQMVRFLH
jgi:uncharacterized protein (DUF2267 family)